MTFHQNDSVHNRVSQVLRSNLLDHLGEDLNLQQVARETKVNILEKLRRLWMWSAHAKTVLNEVNQTNVTLQQTVHFLEDDVNRLQSQLEVEKTHRESAERRLDIAEDRLITMGYYYVTKRRLKAIKAFFIK